MSTCNGLDLQTVRSHQIMPKNLPDHCLDLVGVQKSHALGVCTDRLCSPLMGREGGQLRPFHLRARVNVKILLLRRWACSPLNWERVDYWA